MSEELAITPEIKAMVGREDFFPGTVMVGEASIKRFAVAVGDLNPLYVDENYAKKTKYGGIIAPPTFVFDVIHNPMAQIGDDGRDLSRIMLPPPFTRVVRGGNEYEFHQPVKPSDIISAKRKILNIYEKQGRTGKLIFVVYELTYTNEKGEVLGVNRETLIFMRQQ